MHCPSESTRAHDILNVWTRVIHKIVSPNDRLLLYYLKYSFSSIQAIERDLYYAITSVYYK